MARDPARIDKVIELLRNYWHQYPDLRLGQIVSNCSQRLHKTPDPYYLGDDEMAEALQTTRPSDR